MYYLAKPLGFHPEGTSIEYVGSFHGGGDLYKFTVGDKTRLLFRDEWTDEKPVTEADIQHDGRQGFSEDK